MELLDWTHIRLSSFL